MQQQKLADMLATNIDVHTSFRHKNILFIGSESYDAPTITVIEGLYRLGFSIYTINKPNINSWFCNKIITQPDSIQFDFILSNLHWGTRWSYYAQYNLWNYPKVLIDGDDNPTGQLSWRDKYDYWCKKYPISPPDDIKNAVLSPYRWMESLSSYQPDIVFTSQKEFGDHDSHYLPFGIPESYYHTFSNRPFAERHIHALHIPGGGVRRLRMGKTLAILNKLHLLPSSWVNKPLYGEMIVDDSIRELALQDANIHSYHRWVTYSEYKEALSRAKIVIYPGIHNSPQWDSKRPWEAYASGNIVFLLKPTIDVSTYPLTDICPFSVCTSIPEVLAKTVYLQRKPEKSEQLRQQTFQQSKKFFNSKSIALYFLGTINDNLT